MGRLDGRVALVTGAARGVGAAVARRFVEEGARVAVADVREEEGQAVATGLGEEAMFARHDVSDEESWARTVTAVAETFGGVDVLVNNAGVLHSSLLRDTSLADYERLVRVNQVGCFLGMRAVADAMRDRGGGSIVNTSSIAGLVGMAGAIGYVATKWAVRGMTKAAAIELGRDGTRVNCIHPGGVDTSMARIAGRDPDDPDAAYRRQPVPRIGRPEEIADLVVYLASDESAYCTGAEFVIDGGATAGIGTAPATERGNRPDDEEGSA